MFEEKLPTGAGSSFDHIEETALSSISPLCSKGSSGHTLMSRWPGVPFFIHRLRRYEVGNRIFVVDGREFPDPDPNLKVSEVRQHMMTFFPELFNAETKESQRGEDDIIEFSLISHDAEVGKAAQRLVAQLANQLSQQAPTTLAPICTVDVVKQFLASSYAPRSPNSKQSYKETWDPFSARFDVMPTEPEDIERYVSPYDGENTTRWNILVRLRCVYRFAEERLGLSPNPFKLIKVKKGQAEEAEPITPEQASALFQAIKTDRERIYWYTMYGHGFRLSEAIGINRGHIRDDRVWLEKGKERKEWAPLLAEARDVLLESGNGRGANAPILVGRQGRVSDSTVQSDIKKWLERAGVVVKRASPHTLRHSFSTHLYLNGCDRDTVDQLLRHKDKRDVTSVYLHLSPEQRLRKVREKLERYSLLRMNGGEPELGKKPDFAQLTPELVSRDPATLLPELLDRLAALGDLAKQVSLALGNNGHRAGEVQTILEGLRGHHDSQGGAP